MTQQSINTAVSQLKKAFENGGPREALVFLNSLTTQRFSSLYRFDGDMLRNITFYDRESPDLEECEEIPILASYCVFVRDSGKRFATTEAACDERVQGHPKQKTVQSYCGVPLLDRSGKMFGTICHFDFKPSSVSHFDIELMEHMAKLLETHNETAN
ncbi:MAG: GAF domain-containing protein [Pyrinomonadaceae bacterium]